jgi:geranylgeranyl diphosphate synthase type I
VDIYEEVEQFLLHLPCVRQWPELEEVIRTAVSARPKHWLLPITACQAVGGEIEQAVPAAAAVASLHTSILLVDDMLDADPRGLYHHWGYAMTANLACALQAVGLDVFAETGQPESVELLVLRSLNQMLFVTALGQHWDIHNPKDEPSYWRIVESKSSPFFGTALCVGGLVGGAAGEVVMQLQRIGEIYGEMIQISDDLDDALASPASPDWLQERLPLPILFAHLVPHPEQERFQTLRGQISHPDALAEAQEILIRCGGVSYCIHQLIERIQEVRKQIDATPLLCPGLLHELTNEIASSVDTLLSSATECQQAL